MSFSTRFLAGTGVVVMAAGAALFAQSTDANKIMADMRKALGGDKLAAVKSLSATGKSQRSQGETSMGGDYEMMLELPDKYFAKQAMAQTPMGSIAIKSGFNGDGLIQETEQPPQMNGMMVFRAGGSSPNATPEQKAADQRRQMTTQKQEVTRLALGMFGAAIGAYPLEYSYGGTAESADGKADIINVKGTDDFAGKLFVDQKTHLPLMFTWMGKEPMSVTTNRSGGPGAPGAGVTRTMPGTNGVQVQAMGGTSTGKPPTQEERDQMMKEMEARMAEAEKNRKTVEFRMFYSDYKSVDGVQLPHTFQQAIGSNPSSEITIEKYKINPKIDPKKFDIVK